MKCGILRAGVEIAFTVDKTRHNMIGSDLSGQPREMSEGEDLLYCLP